MMNYTHRLSCWLIGVTASTLLCSTSFTAHAVTEADAFSNTETNFDGNISAQDLAQDRPITSTVSTDAGFRLTGINDGLASSGASAYMAFFGDDALGSGLTSNPQVTISLDTTKFTKGYTLSSINSIYGWQNYAQSFSDQNYVVSYSTVSAPTTFTTLATVNYHPFNPTGDNGTASSSQVTLTNLSVTGVAAIRFTFSPYSNGVNTQGGQVIREINVFGTPTLAVTQATASSSTETTYDGNVSSTDLMNARPITSTQSGDQGFPLTGINDGLVSNTTTGSSSNDTFFGSGNLGSNLSLNPVVTVTLNTTVNQAGYDLSSIRSIYGWQNYAQAFSDQKYTVAYSTISSPTTFIPITSVNFHPFSPTGDPGTASSSQVTLGGLTGITNVGALQFTFSPYNDGTTTQQGQLIREIDAQGTPSTLEGATKDIAPLTWTSTARSDWINVVAYGADPTGASDSTSAIQAALDVDNKGQSSFSKTIYFPAGTYKISSTLKLASVNGFTMVGCGLNTVIRWYGAAGAAMMWTNSVDGVRYLGLVWDGNNLASCGYEDYSTGTNGNAGNYGTQIRHENESFRNFTQPGNYISNRTAPLPPAGIIAGLAGGATTGECQIINCSFFNCGTGVYNALDAYQYYMWFIEGCEFENNGVGFDGGLGGCYIVDDSHFSKSAYADIVGGYKTRCHRLTSSGSGQLFCIGSHGGGGDNVFEDCYVDSWTNPTSAIADGVGPDIVMDCTFTTPPAGAAAPVHFTANSLASDALLSNNTATSSPAITSVSGASNLITVPAGSRSKNITSATKVFIESTLRADSANIIDVTQQASPYNADNTGHSDATAAIQHAITAAQMANNGTIVYLPAGFYRVSSTLNVSGGNYKIQGSGFPSQLLWFGSSGANVFTVSTPQTIKMEQLQISVPDIYTTGVYETSTGASNMTYDMVNVSGLNTNNYYASGDNLNGMGITLSNLPASSTVSIPVLNSPLSVIDCGPAQILVKMGYFGTIHVSGATHAKTGFTGMVVAEGRQPEDTTLYNFNITDNQNLVVGSYYTEQTRNDVTVARGAGTTTGSVTILGLNSASGVNGQSNPSQTMIFVNNYAGRLFYGETGCSNDGGVYPVQITQSGSNAVDLITEGTFYGENTLPTFTLDTGANSIRTLNSYSPSGTTTEITDTPNPLTTANLTSISGALDDIRHLGAVDLSVAFP